MLTLCYTMYTYLRAWAVLLFGDLFQHCFSALIVQILQIWVSLVIGCAILFTATIDENISSVSFPLILCYCIKIQVFMW